MTSASRHHHIQLLQGDQGHEHAAYVLGRRVEVHEGQGRQARELEEGRLRDARQPLGRRSGANGPAGGRISGRVYGNDLTIAFNSVGSAR
jgi:hypothetical protein